MTRARTLGELMEDDGTANQARENLSPTSIEPRHKIKLKNMDNTTIVGRLGKEPTLQCHDGKVTVAKFKIFKAEDWKDHPRILDIDKGIKVEMKLTPGADDLVIKSIQSLQRGNEVSLRGHLDGNEMFAERITVNSEGGFSY